MTLRKTEAQKFLKRFRKHLSECRVPVKIRHLLIGEYAPQTARPHYHALILNCCAWDNLVGHEHPHYQALKKSWTLGHLDAQELIPERIHYVAASHALGGGLPPDQLAGREPGFRLMSNKPGLGGHYVPKLAHTMAKHRDQWSENAFWLSEDGETVTTTPEGHADVLDVYRTGGKKSAIPEYLKMKVRETLGVPQTIRAGRTARWKPSPTFEERKAAHVAENRYREKLQRSGKLPRR